MALRSLFFFRARLWRSEAGRPPDLRQLAAFHAVQINALAGDVVQEIAFADGGVGDPREPIGQTSQRVSV